MNLRYDMIGAYYAGENRHPQLVMRELGVQYQQATPQSMGDQWLFWNCTGMPDPLPPYLGEFPVKPHDMIGWGLSKQDADELTRGAE